MLLQKAPFNVSFHFQKHLPRHCKGKIFRSQEFTDVFSSRDVCEAHYCTGIFLFGFPKRQQAIGPAARRPWNDHVFHALPGVVGEYYQRRNLVNICNKNYFTRYCELGQKVLYDHLGKYNHYWREALPRPFSAILPCGVGKFTYSGE